MDCKAIAREDLGKAKALWKQAFRDSDAYIDHNFAHNLDLDLSLGLFDGGNLVSMLYMLPKTLVIARTGREEPVCFIAGVATDERYRRQGLAAELMEEAQGFLLRRGVPVVYLYPFSHDFYEKRGYRTVSWMRKAVLQKIGAISGEESILEYFDRLNRPDADELLAVYSQTAMQSQSYFRRTREDFEKIIDTMAVGNGRFAVAYNEGIPSGYVLYYLEQSGIKAEEALFLNQKTAERALRELAQQARVTAYIDEAYGIENSTIEPYAMMRIVDLKLAKRVFGAEDAEAVYRTPVMILEQY